MISKNVIKKSTGALRDNFVNLFYDSFNEQFSQYGLTSDVEKIAYFAQIGHETNGLYYVEELASGIDYEGRNDLGNVNQGDGVRYKGRGLIQLTGRSNYRKAGQYLNDNYESNPSDVSPTNTEHRQNTGRTDQYDNAVKSSLWFWKKGSAWGDLSIYANQIDIDQGLFLGDFDPSRLPNKNSEFRNTPFNLRPKKGGRSNPSDYTGTFLVDYLNLDRNGNGKSLFMFELISLGINGGYNGFRDRYEKFEAGRKAYLGDDYEEPYSDTNNDNRGSETGSEQDTDTDTNRENNENEDNYMGDDFESLTGIENIFPPTISLEEMSINTEGDIQSTVEVGKNPFVMLNDVQIDLIEDFTIASSGFLPTLSMTFVDQYSYYDNLRFPNDDARVKVFISSRSKLLRPIYCEFKILNFKKVGHNRYSIKGMLNVNRMYVTNVESYRNLTSYNVMKEVAKTTQLGFSTNISDTDDQMTWINTNNRRFEFCKDVIKRSYKSDTSYMWGFVDFYYNLNFIDIEEQLAFDLKKQLGIVSGGINEIQDKLAMVEEREATAIYLSNDGSGKHTSNYFETYNIYNNSTNLSIKRGYENFVKYYDWDTKDLLIFNMGSITNPDNVILKAEDSEFLKENVSHLWEGKLLKNTHDNYHYANIQNEINLDEIQKIGLEIILPNLNFNIYRFMKVFVMFINQGDQMINPKYNAKLSGEWLIIDIQFFMEDNVMKQRVKLIRKDLGFSQEEAKS